MNFQPPNANEIFTLKKLHFEPDYGIYCCKFIFLFLYL